MGNLSSVTAVFPVPAVGHRDGSLPSKSLSMPPASHLASVSRNGYEKFLCVGTYVMIPIANESVVTTGNGVIIANS